jgi:hypothetical protein
LLQLKLLFLVMLANGAPVATKLVLGDRYAFPLDGGRRMGDGRPWLGTSKTLRGVLVAVAVAAAGAVLFGLSVYVGMMIGALAMAGDLFSSFIKRRLDLPPSSRATGLDQIPEVLLPVLACYPVFGLRWWDVLWITVAFVIVEMLLSKLLFRLRLRDRPY